MVGERLSVIPQGVRDLEPPNRDGFAEPRRASGPYEASDRRLFEEAMTQMAALVRAMEGRTDAFDVRTDSIMAELRDIAAVTVAAPPDRSPLDEIKARILKLTYDEMIELGGGVSSLISRDDSGSPKVADTDMAKVMSAWAKSQKAESPP
jgi:hypothetical protein